MTFMVSKKIIAAQLLGYMQHKLSLLELIDWAEKAILNGGFENGHEETIRTVLGRLAAADSTAFGMLWENCNELMRALGYVVKVEAALVA